MLPERDWDLGRSGRVVLRAGGSLPLDRSDVAIDVVAPDPDGVRAFFEPQGLPERLRKRANELSAVLHVRFGEARLVLGADLPEKDHGVGSRTGWTRVLASYPDLPGSIVLKVPHHGSDGAMHPKMVGAGVAPEGAIWALTPFQGGPTRPLPKLRDGKGVAALLDGVPSVYLTALPAGWTSTAPLDGPVSLNALHPQRSRLPSLPGALIPVPAGSPPCKPLEPIWLFAVDKQGLCGAKHRGDRALETTR